MAAMPTSSTLTAAGIACAARLASTSRHDYERGRVVIFYPGLHQPSDAKRFERCCISVKRLKTRRAPLMCPHVLLDFGAFTELAQHGRYRASVQAYANEIKRLHHWGVAAIDAAVTQDFMCEPFMLAKTGLTVEDHQRLTIERYDALLACRLPVPLMPVLQGYTPAEYLDHLEAYGARLELRLGRRGQRVQAQCQAGRGVHGARCDCHGASRSQAARLWSEGDGAQ